MAIKQIDFSSMHHVLIRNKDGSLTPMDEPYYESELVAPGVWKIISDGDCHYLVEGESETLAIDTGYGAGNLREYLQSLTDKPVKYVANTHHHFDHTANNGYFDGAYMSAGSVPLATIPYASFEGIPFITDYPRIPLQEGDTIDLGGRVLEVIELQGHTDSSLAYFDRKNHILFTGDELDKFVNLSCPVSDFMRSMEKLSALRGEIDLCFGGHGRVDPDNIDKCLALARDIVNGTLEEPDGKGPKGGPPPKKEWPPVPEGTIVYDRQSPRKGDGGGGNRSRCKMAAGHGVRLLYSDVTENA